MSRTNTKNWKHADIAGLPYNLIRVLRVFIKTDKSFLDSDDIQKELKVEGKNIGAILAAFQKVHQEKDWLIKPLFKITKTTAEGVKTKGSRWIINQDYMNEVKKAVSELEPYLD